MDTGEHNIWEIVEIIAGTLQIISLQFNPFMGSKMCSLMHLFLMLVVLTARFSMLKTNVDA